MADAVGGKFEIELVYALPQEQSAEILHVPAGTTIRQAIRLSRLLARHPDLAAGPLVVGIFGRRAAPSTVVREFDRIEIYRPLIADPKQARRARARRGGRSGR